ncbi:MAG: SPOR domain-containing protein [Christensenellales bacterium]
MSTIRYGSRRRYGGFRAKKAGSYTKGFLILISIGIFMYVFIAGATGKWVADNIVMPVISLVHGETKNASPVSTAPNAKTTESNNTQVSETVKVEGVSCYLLQFGAFSQSTNAETEAKNAKGHGAAGYVLEGDGYFRVIASAYNTVEDLKAVQTRLKDEEKLETGSYLLESRVLELKVSGTKTQLDALKASFEAIKDLQGTLNNMVLEFDRQNLTQISCLESLKAEIRKLDTAKEGMDESAKSSTVAAAIVDLLMKLSDHMSSIEVKDTTAEFSSLIKYAQIYALDSYHQFIVKLSEQ